MRMTLKRYSCMMWAVYWMIHHLGGLNLDSGLSRYLGTCKYVLFYVDNNIMLCTEIDQNHALCTAITVGGYDEHNAPLSPYRY